MAKTTRPKTNIQPDAADAVEMSDPVVMLEPDAPAEILVEQAPEPEPEPVIPEPKAGQPAPPPVRPEAAKQSSGFGGMVLGGVIAAALGYGVAIYAPIAGFSDQTAQTAEAQAALSALGDRVATLEATPAPAPSVDLALTERVQALEATAAGAPNPDLSALTKAIAALDGRIAVIEAAPRGEGGAASPELAATVAALRAEVEGLKGSGSVVSAEIAAAAEDAQARLAEAEAQATQLKAEAEETARKAMSRAAVSRLQAALESGAPFETALADLPGLEVPAVLTDAASGGIPSRTALEDAFPDAARAALEASLQADMGDTLTDRLFSFAQSTTGARSLTPREGTDPDAVLSRAEAAIKAGDLPAALTELQGLPPEGQAAMADFTALAQQRLDAAAAVATLSAAIEG